MKLLIETCSIVYAGVGVFEVGIYYKLSELRN